MQDPLAVQAIRAYLARSGAPVPPGPAPPARAAIGQIPRATDLVMSVPDLAAR